MNRIVVADAGPLHYLALVDCADILAELFHRVLVPVGVRDELLHPTAPAKVKNWLAEKKPWLSIETVEQPQVIRGLHKGETEALRLALRTKAPAVLMDDLDGRAAARQLGIVTIGTLSLLERAAELRLIELPKIIGKLRQTNFFISPELLEAVLQRDQKRRVP